MGLKSISKLKKELDKWFSLYIRLREATTEGMVQCITCGCVKNYKQGMQNGHFISRSSRILRWREDNCRVQCYSCNCMRYGQAYIFGANLNKEFGFNKAEELLIESKKIVKQSDQDLLDLIDEYKEKVSLL